MWWLQLRRLAHTRRIAGTALQQCWRRPLPGTATDWRQVPFLVVDAEMSSLAVTTGELLSVGWVRVDQGCITLASLRHCLVKAERSVGQSAIVHRLRDCDLNEAETGAAVMQQFCEAAAGRVLVFHHARLDLAYLDRLSRQQFNAPLLLPTVDTLVQERALLLRRHHPVQPAELQLQACRDRYNLPRYPAHNAALDALATAELLVAMATHRSAGKDLPLGRLL